MTKIFIKQHSREYTLFRVFVLHEIYSKWLLKKLGIKMEEGCMVYRSKGLIDVYYQPKTWEHLFQEIGKKSSKKSFVDNGIKNTLEYFEKLKPYFVENRIPATVKELKKVYDLYIQYYLIGSAIAFVTPQIPTVPEEHRKKAYALREKIQEYNEAIEIVFKKSLEKLYPQWKEKIQFILPQEVWQEKVADPDFAKIIAEREQGFVFWNGKLYAGSNVDNNLKKLGIELSEGEVVEKETKELKGQIAHKGVVQGKVKVVNSIKEIDKVKDGEILVAAMTMPSYIATMKKSAAFVTDEGGITCHAAIVAREMKKPCIIGTKVATKILKDDDFVEVDADSGVVRILEK